MQNDQPIKVVCNESNAAQVAEILKVIYRLGGFPHVSVEFERNGKEASNVIKYTERLASVLDNFRTKYKSSKGLMNLFHFMSVQDYRAVRYNEVLDILLGKDGKE